jgi:hypothetical protein
MRAFVFAVAAIVLAGLPAAADKRIALVVGNDAYANLGADQQLRRAVNDARAVGNALDRLGFEVIRGENLNRQDLVEKLDELARKVSQGDTAFFFFAGHGVSISGGNYILPTDVPNVQVGQEVRLARTAIGESEIVSDLQARGVRVAVVVLDACRNNPLKRPGMRAIGGERGLARSDPVRGIFSLYSAGIGQTALDRLGDGDASPNSVFTRVLVPALARPGLDLSALAVEVREEVARLAGTVGHDQRPAYYDETIGGRVYLAGLPQPAQTPAATGVPAGEAWGATKDTTSIPVLEEFARRYSDSYYAVLARARIDELKKAQTAAVPPSEPSRPPAVTRPAPTAPRAPAATSAWPDVPSYPPPVPSFETKAPSASSRPSEPAAVTPRPPRPPPVASRAPAEGPASQPRPPATTRPAPRAPAAAAAWPDVPTYPPPVPSFDTHTPRAR